MYTVFFEVIPTTTTTTVALYYAMFIYTSAIHFHVLSYELTPKCHYGATYW